MQVQPITLQMLPIQCLSSGTEMLKLAAFSSQNCFCAEIMKD